MDQLNLEKSRRAWKEALDLIPTGTQMMSKTAGQFVEGEYPYFVESGKGCELRDLDGNHFVDTFSAFGTVLLGYAHEGVNAAIRRQLDSGIIFSLPHNLEARVARLLRELVPCAEMSRFFKTGSEATTAAIRLARAFTGRTLIAKGASGYHGWHDWHAAGTPRKAGIPDSAPGQIFSFPYNDLTAAETLFREHPGKIACIILEPVVLEKPQPGFLQGLQDLARREGALLIFDEIVSGLRFAPGGAQAYYGVTPDLATFGKAMANGMPLSALCGRKQFMKRLEQPDVFVSSTFGGEAVSLAAAEIVLHVVQTGEVSDVIWERGSQLLQGLNAAAKELGVPLAVNGLPPRMALSFGKCDSATEAEVRTFFLRECVRRGALFGNVILLNGAHTVTNIDTLLTAAREAMGELGGALRNGDLQQRLEGRVAAAAFNPRGN
jgi:glutamate-1-semialdehyde aminotransferase